MAVTASTPAQVGGAAVTQIVEAEVRNTRFPARHIGVRVDALGAATIQRHLVGVQVPDFNRTRSINQSRSGPMHRWREQQSSNEKEYSRAHTEQVSTDSPGGIPPSSLPKRSFSHASPA